MNLVFDDSRIKVYPEGEDIIIAGRVVGYVISSVSEHTGKLRFHSVISVPDSNVGLIQGHGDTRESAILNSFRCARRSALEMMSYADKLESEMITDDDINACF